VAAWVKELQGEPRGGEREAAARYGADAVRLAGDGSDRAHEPGRGGRAGKAELLTSIEGANSRPVGVGAW
jgi:hypothetical protein